MSKKKAKKEGKKKGTDETRGESENIKVFLTCSRPLAVKTPVHIRGERNTNSKAIFLITLENWRPGTKYSAAANHTWSIGAMKPTPIIPRRNVRCRSNEEEEVEEVETVSAIIVRLLLVIEVVVVDAAVVTSGSDE